MVHTYILFFTDKRNNYLYSKLVSISPLETNLESKILVVKTLLVNLYTNLETIL